MTTKSLGLSNRFKSWFLALLDRLERWLEREVRAQDRRRTGVYLGTYYRRPDSESRKIISRFADLFGVDRKK